MTKPAPRDVVVKVRSAPAATESDTSAPSGALQVAVPRPLPGLARPVGGSSGDQPRADPAAGTAVARLRRQAARRDDTVNQPATAPPRSRTLDELRRRAGALAGRLVLRRQVVTQLRLRGDRPDEIAGVAIVGRPPTTFSGSMGDHTTAFTVHVNAVQHALEGAPVAEAAARLGVLVSELRSLPGYAMVNELLPARHLALWQAALATITDVRRRLAVAAGDVGLIQQYVGAYLELRELVPLSTVNTGQVSKATSGKGKGETVEALRAQAAGKAQKPEELAAEILGLFDVRAAALACAETDPVRLAALAPGLPADRGPRERGHLIVLQHLRSIQTGYPGALAALAGEKVADISSGSGDSPAKVAADRRKAAQDADDKVLGRLIEEILSNHVMPRMVTAVLGELESLQADQARDEAALRGYEIVGSDRALNSGKTGKKADAEKARITGQLELTRARIKQLHTVLGSDSVFTAKSSPSSGGIGKVEPKTGLKPDSGDGMESTPRSGAGDDLGAASGGRSKRKREPKVDRLDEGRKREARQRHERALQQAGRKAGRRPGTRGRGRAAVRSVVMSGVASGESGGESEIEETVGKRARVDPSGPGGQASWDGVAQSSANPVFSGLDPVPVAEPEAPAPPARQTVQVILNDAGNVAEIRAAGRPPSPFPGGTMGAHTTAWTVHLDRVRAALGGLNVADATAMLQGPLRREREASAAAMSRAFRFKHALPAVSAVADGRPSLTRLQEQIVSHLEQLNLIPGATLPSADTGGKGEGRHRRVLREAARHAPAVVHAAVLGMLDVAGLADRSAEAELDVARNAAQVLVAQHLATIAAAYPDALARARINPREDVEAIAATVMARVPAEKSSKPGAPKPVAEDDDEDADEPRGSAPSVKVPLTLDDRLFGAHLPPGAPSLASGRPESAPPPLLGSAAALVLPSEADRAAAALWLDPAGNLIDARLEQFTAAYTGDIRDAGTYLAEGEGTVAARHFRVCVRVYRDAAPPEFERHDNRGGGDCLLHALHHVAQAAARQPLTELGADEIGIARAAIVAGLPAEDARNATRAIVTDAVEQRHVAGLGTRMRALLNNPGFRHAAAWVRTARHREALEASLKAKADPPKPPPPPKKKEEAPPPLAPPVLLHQAVYGDGAPLVDQALLHTGGNHYVALIRRAPAPVLDRGPSLASGLLSARPPSLGLPGLGMVPIPTPLPLPSLPLLPSPPPPPGQGRPPTTATPATPPERR